MDEIIKLSEEHSQYISCLAKKINENNEKDILYNIYRYVKGVSTLYYDGISMHNSYNLIRFSIALAEGKIRSKIIDIPIAFELSDNTNKDDFFLDFLVYNTRKYLVEKGCWNISRISFDKINFANECQNAANYIKKLCDDNGIESYILLLAPGYDKNVRLYDNDGLGFHYFNIVKINNEYYLIDLTYSQFFYTNHNVIDRIGLVNIPPCNPGYFMLMSENGFDIAKQIIKNGYIRLNEDIFKTYLDAFTISFRNGLYYESTNDFSFKVDYTIDDYINFFKGFDSQVNKEGIENLGYQNRPLSKVISFKRK